MDHKALIASLSDEQRRALTSRSNSRAVIPLLLHFGLIAVLWLFVLERVPGWQLLILPLGILIVFLFTLLHETCHRTTFRSKQINIALSWVCGVMIALPPNWFRYFHYEHHRHTQDPQRDPELQMAKPATPVQYIWYLSGLPVWYGQLKVILNNAMGNCTDAFVPASASRVIVIESCVLLFMFSSMIFLVAFSAHADLVLVWIVALLAGQPFLRLFLLAEHGRCPFVGNMFENTRTTFTNRIVRGLAWNMPFHAEHHAYPNVPFYNLPVFHQLVRNRLVVTSNGYSGFHREVVQAFRDDKRNL